LNLQAHKLFIYIFLLTGLFNNLYSNSIDSSIVENDNIFLDSEIEKYAEDSIDIDIDGRKVHLYGNSKITYKNTTITAAYILINWEENTIFATSMKDSANKDIGYPILTENKSSFKAKEITYNFKSKKCYVKQITTKEGDGYILGKIVKKMEDDILYFKKGDYTTCDAEKPHYSIRSNKIKVIPGKKIITGPAYLTFFNIPTPLIFPFGYFPNNTNQSSGIIIPSYGESQELGFFLKNGGYYLPINKKADLTFKGDIYSKGSWNVKSMLNYKKRYKYSGSLNLSFANMTNSEKGFPNYNLKRDFFIRWKHNQDAKTNPNLQISANVNAGTSTFHRNNLSNTNDYLSNTFQSNISLRKKWANSPFSLSSNIRHNQNTQSKIINLSLPEISLNMNRIFPFKHKISKDRWYEKVGLRYSMNAKNDISIVDSLLFTKNTLSKFRNGIKHTIPINTSLKVFNYLTLNPSLNFTERWYFSQINKNWDGNNIITDTIRTFTRAHEYNLSSSLSTKIYGLVQFKKGKIKAIRHVLTPNISFSYKPDFSQEKFNYYKQVQINNDGDKILYSIMENGIYGSPSRGETGNINLNINNVFEMKVNSKNDTSQSEKKIKILESLNISSSYNLLKDSLNLSNINLNARTRILKVLDINFSSTYDPYITNKSKNNNLNILEINKNNRLARLKNLNTSIGLNINDKSFNTKNSDETRSFIEIPWDLRLNYNLTYNKGYNSAEFADTIQSLNFSGNVKISDKWKLGFRSGYDFDSKDLTYTSIDIYRDLHCWELMFNYIPFGFQRSYTLTIQVKAPSLRDLKYERKRDWFNPDYN
tara:strand:+ start:31363 stop:33816 length:2454 start_codon:yes stop_codon:yes gene_type:complete